jgi:hypothetical protein
MAFEPLQGWRHVQVTDRRMAQDVAHGMKDVVALHVPQAAVVRVVLDDLKTHPPAARYANVPPADACRIWRQLDFHDTPQHGSGLTMAAIEFAVVSPQCVDRRLGDQETVHHPTAAWQTGRNAAKIAVDRHFTTAKAPRQLTHIYPL